MAEGGQSDAQSDTSDSLMNALQRVKPALAVNVIGNILEEELRLTQLHQRYDCTSTPHPQYNAHTHAHYTAAL